MKQKRSVYYLALFVLLCRAADMPAQEAAELAPQVPYRLSTLADSLDGFQTLVPADINSYGQVAAEIDSINFDRAILWTPDAPNAPTGSMIDLIQEPGILFRDRARGINSYGQVAGFSIYPEPTAWLWTPTTRNGTSGTIKNLEKLPGSTVPSGFAEGINDFGQVAGQTVSAPGLLHAFLWTPSAPNGTTGSMIDLGTLPGGTESRAWGINAPGQVVGHSGTNVSSPFGWHAFLWNPLVPNSTVGAMFDLGELPGGEDRSIARRINSSGQVAGESGAATGTRAFLWTPALPNTVIGSMIDLGDLTGGRDESKAFAINDHGHVVGSSATESGDHAFLWVANSPGFAHGTMIDLNTLLNPADRSRWTLVQALGINDFGQIVGGGFFDADGPGPMQARPLSFLLTPIPEPPSVVLLWISAFCIRRRAVWWRMGG